MKGSWVILISHLPTYSLIEVELSANWLACSKLLTVTETCLEWIFSITPWPLWPFLLMSQLLSDPLLQYTDDKCHQEPSVQKCNQEPLTVKCHQEPTKSANGTLNFI